MKNVQTFYGLLYPDGENRWFFEKKNADYAYERDRKKIEGITRVLKTVTVTVEVVD